LEGSGAVRQPIVDVRGLKVNAAELVQPRAAIWTVSQNLIQLRSHLKFFPIMLDLSVFPQNKLFSEITAI